MTAQRRTENAQTVPIAISAISGDTLAQTFGVNNIETLQQAVPGLAVSMDTSNPKIFLRGVGTTAVATDNSVGVYIDSVYIASQGASFMNLANIDHVEVDKGPQGTLFGRNTTAGVVQIVTKTPSSTPSADLTFGYGNYNTFTLNFYATSIISPNLVADFAYYYNNQLDSPGKNVTTGTKNILRQNAEVIRNKWLWTPTDAHRAGDYAIPYTARCLHHAAGLWRDLCTHLCRRHRLHLSLVATRAAPHSRATGGDESQTPVGGGQRSTA